MKVKVTSKVIINLPITFRQMVLLKDLSSHHYDYHCRTVGEVGGFLYGWWNQFYPHVGPSNRIEVVAIDWGQLDTMFKLMEIPPTQKTAAQITLFNMMIKTRALMLCYSEVWSDEVEL